MKTFAERLKYYREEHLKMGLREMGREAGLSGANIHSWESGGSQPTLSKLKKIYQTFPLLSPAWLEDGKGEMLLNAASRQPLTGEVIEELKAAYEKIIEVKDAAIAELRADKSFLQEIIKTSAA